MNKRCLVTGVAGFIGSNLAQRLVDDGLEVLGLDCFTDCYARGTKEANLDRLRGESRFEFIEGDLVRIVLEPILKDVGWVFHQAAQAGVRASWGDFFHTYSDNNILGTQHLLETIRGLGASSGGSVERIVYASSSSIYGEVEEGKTTEDATPCPISPYGVSKLAGEQLGYLYWRQFSLPIISLRYFTVYGPRQRPDMAFNRFIEALLDDGEIEIYGDGEQTRDFTFISDAIDANLAAVKEGKDGNVYNIGGGERASINRVVDILEEVSNRKVRRKFLDQQAGDVRHTWADISRAAKDFGFSPKVGLMDGIRQQYEWQQRRRWNGNQQGTAEDSGLSQVQRSASTACRRELPDLRCLQTEIPHPRRHSQHAH